MTFYDFPRENLIAKPYLVCYTDRHKTRIVFVKVLQKEQKTIVYFVQIIWEKNELGMKEYSYWVFVARYNKHAPRFTE